MDSFIFPEAAVPLIEVSSDRERLEVNEEAAALLSKVECAVCPVCVVGLYRSGKSSLLNFLNGRQRGFAVGPSVSRCTRGVWVYGKPTVQRLADGTEVATVLLDTEGIGGLEADAQYDTRIFALSALLAASLVYNSLGSIDENAISQLSFVAQLSKHVRFKEPLESVAVAPMSTEETLPPSRLARRSSSVELDNEEDAARLGGFMPSFTWVLRDFSLELVDATGEAITADEYLEASLRPQRGYEASVLERNRLRHMLASFFPRRACHALVRPVHDEAKLQQIDEVQPSELRPEFSRGVDELRDALFAPENIRPKTINGTPLRGRAYVELVRKYVDAMNRGGVPVISSAWDHVSRLECRAAADDALATFGTAVADAKHRIRSQKTPLEADALEALFSAAKDASLAVFRKRAIGDNSDDARADLVAKIKAQADDLANENHRVSDRYCEDVAAKLYVGVVWASLATIEADGPETPADLATSLAASWAEHRRRYATTARGPAKDKALLKFAHEKWPEAAHELVRRIEARHDSDAQREHDRLLKLKADLAEYEGTKEARAKMLEDAQQTLVTTQLDKARAEARCSAVSKQLEDARAKEKKTRANLERKVGDLELELERLRNQIASSSAPSARRHPEQVELVGKGGCKCTIA